MTMPNNKMQTTAFYDTIAEQYDSHLTASDESVRNIVAGAFEETVKGAKVMDFGGGTGLDLHWLTKKYQVFFVEPSTNMRSVAVANNQAAKHVTFIDNK